MFGYFKARFVFCLTIALCSCHAAPAAPKTLELVQTIDLKGPEGRLDHMALDAKHDRLFVANMANSSLDIVDLKAGKLSKQISDQKKIQGVAYAPDVNRIFVGNGEGVCNVFDGQDYKLLKAIKLDDADNVRYSPRNKLIYLAHAEKRLAVIDPDSHEIKADIKLPGDPEAFTIEKGRPRIYLNCPSSREVVVIDTDKNEVIEHFPLKLASNNYPIALDEANHRLFCGCRKKAMIVVLDTESGKEITGIDIPGDTDDVFYDAKHKRIYAACGEGQLAVIAQKDADRYETVEKVATGKLARTGHFDPEAGRLYVIVPKQGDQAAPVVRVYETRP
jgi:DNA-binding beta-propeller fold protein YncE